MQKYTLLLVENEHSRYPICIADYRQCMTVMHQYIGAYDALFETNFITLGQLEQIRMSFYLEEYNDDN